MTPNGKNVRFRKRLSYCGVLRLLPRMCFTSLLLLCACMFHVGTSEIIELTFPRCNGSPLGEEAELTRVFIATQDVRNNDSESFSVKLVEERLQCDGETGRLANLQVSSNDSHDLSKVFTLFRSGYLLHDKTYYSREEFCLQSITDDEGNFTVTVKICEPRCSGSACMHKCCEPGKVWDLQNYHNGNGKLSCVPSGPTIWRPFFYENKYDKVEKMEGENIKVRYMDSHPKNFCDGGFFLMTLKDYDGMDASPFRVLKDGSVIMKSGRSSWEDVPSSVYCVDGAMNFIHSGTNGSMDAEELEENYTLAHEVKGEYSGNESDTVMLVCTDFLEDPDTSLDGTTNYLYVVAMIVASVFLFLTVVVYVVLWKRQNVHGWTFLGYVISLLLTFLFLSAAHLMTSGDSDCFVIGIASHFFFLSTFSWLTALNFDIYWTFRSLNPNPGRRKEIVRFLCYSLFAIGLPTVIVSVGLILDEIYGDDPESEVIVPRYGVTRCTMDRSADLPYTFGPISVLLACNLILFPTTLFYVYKSRKLTKLSGMKSSMLKHKIHFFGKLFMLAGVTWIFEVISWACTDPGKPIHWIWKFLDLVNILQAVAIFVVFVCNRKTLHELSEKFPCLKRLNSIIEKASGVAANSTRRPSNTHVSSIFDAPGLDTVELS